MTSGSRFQRVQLRSVALLVMDLGAALSSVMCGAGDAVLRCNGRWSALAFHKHRWPAGCEWLASDRGQLRAHDGPGRLPMSIRSLARCGQDPRSATPAAANREAGLAAIEVHPLIFTPRPDHGSMDAEDAPPALPLPIPDPGGKTVEIKVRVAPAWRALRSFVMSPIDMLPRAIQGRDPLQRLPLPHVAASNFPKP